MKFIFKTTTAQQCITEILVKLDNNQLISLHASSNSIPIYFSTVYFLAKLRVLDQLALPMQSNERSFDFSAGFIFKDLISELVFNDPNPDSSVRINQHLSRFNKLLREKLKPVLGVVNLSVFENRTLDNEKQVRFLPADIEIYQDDILLYKTANTPQAISQLTRRKSLVFPVTVSAVAAASIVAIATLYLVPNPSPEMATPTLVMQPKPQYSQIAASAVTQLPAISEGKDSIGPNQVKRRQVSAEDVKRQQELAERLDSLLEQYKQTGKYEYVNELKAELKTLPRDLLAPETKYRVQIAVLLADGELDEAYALMAEQVAHDGRVSAQFRERLLTTIDLHNNNWRDIIARYEGLDALSYDEATILKRAYSALGLYDKISEVNNQQLAQHFPELAQITNQAVAEEPFSVFIDELDSSQTPSEQATEQLDVAQYLSAIELLKLTALLDSGFEQTKAAVTMLKELFKADQAILTTVAENLQLDVHTTRNLIRLLIERVHLKQDKFSLVDSDLNDEVAGLLTSNQS
ncbi:hypothetical protein ACFOEE_10130 [Pseudoalteromonas fenneropenaei]|uniref:Uncharacterized protein n=1 Tax=Pseudoalteromonas fenneropenaei TaxID=1737459 RepID=A0ABV7CJQ9_9GAMM